jgi:Flp pilus assembly protein TadD
MTFRRSAVLAAFLLPVALALGLWTFPTLAQIDGLQDANRLFKLGQYDSALERVNAHIEKRPKDARGRFLKGLILTEQNKRSDAIQVFIGLTQDFPELPEPYNNLAVLYAAQGQYDRARNLLESAINAHPGYATAHENLGDIYARMAVESYGKALKLDRNNTSAKNKLNTLKGLFPSGATSPPVK